MWLPDWQRLGEPTRWPQLTLRQYLVLALIAIGLATASELAWSQGGAGFSEQSCRHFGRFALNTANVRDAGAQPKKHIQVLRRSTRPDQLQLLPIFEREVFRVYAEGLTPDKAEEAAYTRCMTGEILRKDS